jgi:anti-sigma factor RsiW
MSHLDEGTLHALLDGELETTEVAEIQAHLGSCSACGLRLREVKEFLGEADRLIASVELGAQPVGAAPSAAKAEAAPRHEPIARPEAPARREPPPRPLPAEAPAREPWNEPPPVLLIPDNESSADRRARRLRRFGWGALAASMVGAGFLGVKMRPTQPGLVPIAARDAADSGAVVSPAEAAPSADQPATPESVAFAAKDRRSESKTKTDQPSPTNAAAAGRPARELASRTIQKQAKPAVPKALQPRDERSDVQTIDSLAEDTADKNEADSAAVTDIADVRERAAEALADLDRERRRDRAAAATAALDSERRRRNTAARTAAPASGVAAAAAAPAPTPPAPPTMEQRAQVYTRIGLDEASQQLGGPTHVIEGLSPMFMGLTRGTGVLGADPGRPVVRVVYQDSQGRLILLDQQRLAARQSPPAASPLSWMIGQTAIWLNGEASGQILRTYRPRVR